MEEDLELKRITARKMAEMRQRMGKATPPAPKPEKPKKSSRELVLEVLYDRGDEVLERAYETYPRETAMIVDQIARLVEQKRIGGKISGGELYSIFRQIGLRFSLNTTIKIEEKGRLVDLAEKLRVKNEEEEEEERAA